MQMTPTTPDHSVIAIAIPDATATLLEIVADNRGIYIGELAAILLQEAVINAARVDRREELQAEGAAP